MLDVKEGDHLALPMGVFAAPMKLTVTRVLTRYVETDDGRAWNREHGTRWGGAKGFYRVEPWGPQHDLAVQAAAARTLLHQIGRRLASATFGQAASALPHLREAAKALGMEVE
jgi:hypothetical protein